MSNEYYESHRQPASRLTPEQQRQVDELIRQQGLRDGPRPDEPGATFDGIAAQVKVGTRKVLYRASFEKVRMR